MHQKRGRRIYGLYCIDWTLRNGDPIPDKRPLAYEGLDCSEKADSRKNLSIAGDTSVPGVVMETYTQAPAASA